jgi:glutamate synthase (NADPH/NADH)
VFQLCRAVGTTLSHEVTKRFGDAGLPDGTIHIKLTGGCGAGMGGVVVSAVPQS